jgi:hypothetical protein
MQNIVEIGQGSLGRAISLFLKTIALRSYGTGEKAYEKRIKKFRRGLLIDRRLNVGIFWEL